MFHNADGILNIREDIAQGIGDFRQKVQTCEPWNILSVQPYMNWDC